jgi:hypothetical protein
VNGVFLEVQRTVNISVRCTSNHFLPTKLGMFRRAAAVVRFSQPRLVWQQMFRRAAAIYWIALVF